jgi:hypothetical protein
MSHEKLYTMLLEYKGGTYVSQVSGNTVGVAIKKWAKAVSDQELKSWGLTRAEITRLANDNPLPLVGCSNVWCLTDSTKKGLILVNVVATEGQ